MKPLRKMKGQLNIINQCIVYKTFKGIYRRFTCGGFRSVDCIVNDLLNDPCRSCNLLIFTDLTSC